MKNLSLSQFRFRDFHKEQFHLRVYFSDKQNSAACIFEDNFLKQNWFGGKKKIKNDNKNI